MKRFYAHTTCDRCGTTTDVPAHTITQANVMAGLMGWAQCRNGLGGLDDLCPPCADARDTEMAVAVAARKTAARRTWVHDAAMLTAAAPRLRRG